MNTSLLKTAFRNLKSQPFFSMVIVFTIAIVTGTSIVVYSYIDALLLSPLPFKEPGKLVRIHSVKGDEQGLVSYPEFLDMQIELNGIEELAVYRDGGRYNLSGDGKPPEDLTTTFASSNLFRVLGVKPVIGNDWPETLDRRGSHTVMLTHEFWKRRFDGNEKIEGLDITLDGFSYTNYGVLPEGFSFPVRNEAFRAMAFADFVVGARDFRPCIGLARLAPNMTLQEFNHELKKFADLQQQRHPASNLGVSFVAEPLADLFIGNMTNYLVLLGVAALFLVTIATINVSNLMASTAIRQRRQTIVRKVLGSSNYQVAKRFIFNALVLSVFGSGIGLAWGGYFIHLSYDMVSQYLPYWIEVDVNGRVLIYAFILSVALGFIVGLVAWGFQWSQLDLAKGLKEGQNTTGSKYQKKIQQSFAVFQIFTSILLLVGGGLLFKSFQAAQHTDLGFETADKLTFRIALSWFKYNSPEKKQSFFETSLKRIQAIPGVESVAMNSVLPLTDIVKTSTQSQAIFTIEGQSEVAQSENPFISVQRITPNYFDLMEIDFLKGRTFSNAEYTSHHQQVIIDQQLAETLWPGEFPLGKRIKMGGITSDEPYLTVIGVVNNVKHQSITGENIPSIYVSILSNTTTDAYYILKSNTTLAELTPTLTNAILSIDENQPTFEYMNMSDHVEMKNWQSKVSSFFFLAVAIIGSIIAAIGLFSIMTFSVIQRMKELAMRRVLGATDHTIFKLVMKDMLKISGVGIGFGLLLSPLLLRPLFPFLFEVSLVDTEVYLFTGLGFLLVSLISALFPTLRSIHLNPVHVLRRD